MSSFEATLATRRRPILVGALEHAVSADAPAGTAHGLAAAAVPRVQRAPTGELTLTPRRPGGGWPRPRSTVVASPSVTSDGPQDLPATDAWAAPEERPASIEGVEAAELEEPEAPVAVTAPSPPPLVTAPPPSLPSLQLTPVPAHPATVQRDTQPPGQPPSDRSPPAPVDERRAAGGLPVEGPGPVAGQPAPPPGAEPSAATPAPAETPPGAEPPAATLGPARTPPSAPGPAGLQRTVDDPTATPAGDPLVLARPPVSTARPRRLGLGEPLSQRPDATPLGPLETPEQAPSASGPARPATPDPAAQSATASAPEVQRADPAGEDGGPEETTGLLATRPPGPDRPAEPMPDPAVQRAPVTGSGPPAPQLPDPTGPAPPRPGATPPRPPSPGLEHPTPRVHPVFGPPTPAPAATPGSGAPEPVQRAEAGPSSDPAAIVQRAIDVAGPAPPPRPGPAVPPAPVVPRPAGPAREAAASPPAAERPPAEPPSVEDAPPLVLRPAGGQAPDPPQPPPAAGMPQPAPDPPGPPLPAPAPSPPQDEAAPLLAGRPVPLVGLQRAPETVPPRLGAALAGQVGADLTGVPVHRDESTGRAADRLQARAFTTAGEIHLPSRHGPLEAQPGRALLAHELVHVAQQRLLGPARPAEQTAAGQQLEREAVAVERTVAAHGLPAPAAGPARTGPAGLPLAQLPGPSSAGPVLGAPDGVEVLDPRSTALASGAAHLDPDGAVVFRTPSATPSALAQDADQGGGTSPQRAPAEPAAPDAPAPMAAPTGDLDELAHRLYDRIRVRLKAELRLDRERIGHLSDLRH